MKYIACLTFVTVFSLLGWSQTDYVRKIQQHRDTINMEFGDSATSILTTSDQEAFAGLNFYPINPSYRVEARFKKVKGKPFNMQTSTSRLPVYQKYGRLKFKVNGKTCKLYVYKQVKAANDTTAFTYVFCPFQDLSNKDSTYGGGRYLDFEVNKLAKRMLIDFNLCYNPYCAYNHRYSCPIPPRENRLDVRIDAGVKKWHE